MSLAVRKLERLSSRVYRVLGCNPGPMTLQGTNTYLIGTGKRLILLDTGNGGISEYVKNLKATLNDLNAYISDVVISHWHPDHVGGIRDVLDVAAASATAAAVPQPRVHKMRSGEHDDSQDERAGHFSYDYIEDGDTFTTDDVTLRAVRTPGHTDDHLVYHLLEEGAVFTGDCILGEGTAVFSDLHQYMASLRLILALYPDGPHDGPSHGPPHGPAQGPAQGPAHGPPHGPPQGALRTLYPGHGPVIRDEPARKIRAYIEHRHAREAQILHALLSRGATGSDSQPITARDIVTTVYTDTPEHLHSAAEGNVLLHLRKLVKDGRVECVVSGDGESGPQQERWRASKL